MAEISDASPNHELMTSSNDGGIVDYWWCRIAEPPSLDGVPYRVLFPISGLYIVLLKSLTFGTDPDVVRDTCYLVSDR